ncbi:LysR family transcriptional regulator [Cupriavidus taiwanensis]|uniref:HTH lysR-type domain-containing protein n=1 Tax=Cupriavidus taiwanensis TaxID=164546 RepID=A0A7Z7JH80_9BURK|nr:LysR family transcriptional regulator [Cupriavidus taiwanensis]SOZ17124.1 hypothetical protein CBM2597_U10001 [Cupriavidus taiwanensis]SOZ96223.1 hypothetical protein CBM2598_U10044 [Cupriavidus taiwanensis]SPC25508.1 hypothetical protein CBM2594_U10009 [Cupriavidus taiwanensis]
MYFVLQSLGRQRAVRVSGGVYPVSIPETYGPASGPCGLFSTMRIDDLRICLALGKTGNLHRAAETLGLTPSALSKALARMEDITGMPLFERTPRGVAPTNEGNALLEHAKRIVRSVDDLQNEFQDRRLARVGTIRLGVVPNLIPSFLSSVLARFLASRPMATFSIDVG